MKKLLNDWWGTLLMLFIAILFSIGYYNYSNGSKYRIIQSQKGDDKGYYYVQSKHWFLFSWWWTYDAGDNDNVKYSNRQQANYIIDKFLEEDRIEEMEDDFNQYKVIPYGAKEESNK